MRTLRARLLASHLAVAAIGVAVLLAVGTSVAGVLARRRMGAMHGPPGADASDILADTLPAAFAWGAVAGVVAAALLALLVTRRILVPLTGIREASRRIAEGDYGHPVPRPQDEELAAVAADLDALGARLAESEARRVRLIDEVAHEMRTPLTTIRGSMEALLDEVVEPSPEVYARVAEEAGRLQRLAEDLSTLSRSEEHALELRLERADLAVIATAAAERLAPQFEHRGVALEVDAGSAVPVEADRDRVAQVLSNLLGNALAHTPEGGVVTLTVERADGTARAEVADTGRGLEAQDVARVFERFYRVPGTGAPAGRGIGLTIARSLARAQGGDVRARSAGPGQGATFTLELPLGS